MWCPGSQLKTLWLAVETAQRWALAAAPLLLLLCGASPQPAPWQLPPVYDKWWGAEWANREVMPVGSLERPGHCGLWTRHTAPCSSLWGWCTDTLVCYMCTNNTCTHSLKHAHWKWNNAFFRTSFSLKLMRQKSPSRVTSSYDSPISPTDVWSPLLMIKSRRCWPPDPWPWPKGLRWSVSGDQLSLESWSHLKCHHFLIKMFLRWQLGTS